ncbi:hypothetical protein KCU85_g6530, partial [Aureobasidium melanogenum]
MFRSLSSKNSTSSSKRKKADRSSRRPESVASSSAHRKHSRNDERSSETEPRNSTSARSPVNDSSGPSSYYTTSDRLHQLEPRSLTEEAIRTLSMQDDGWGDAYPHAEDLPPGDAHADKIPRSHRAYKDEAGPRYNESLEYYSPAENMESNERSLPYKDEPQTSFGTSSDVQDQFPGQDPLTFARSAFNPTMTQDAAATYYNGYRVQPTSSAINQFPQSGPGAAAEYYSQASMQPSEAGNQHVPAQASSAPQDTSHRLTGQTAFSNSPAYPANSYTTGPSNGQSDVNAMTDLTGQNYTYQQPHRPAEAFVQDHSTSHGTYHQHSQSVPSATAYTDQTYNASLPSQLSGYGKQASTNQNLPYLAAVGAAAVAGSQYYHHKMHHHTHSAPFSNNNGGKMYSPPRPYTSGSMAMQHKHKGPISRFVDWWKDYEDVRKMEEYTEYIGVCKYCFDPRSTATDAPRKHYRGGRRSSDSLRRRSSDSLRRSYTNGSKYGRIDKDARYHSSDSERRSKKTSWLGAGVAAYGISKVGKSLWQNSRDFDDTYSVKSGRKSDVSRRREVTSNSSSGHESRSERINDHRRMYVESSDRLETGTQSSARRPEYTRSESKRSQNGRYKGTKSGSVSVEVSRPSQEQIHVRHPSPGVEYETSHPASRRGYKSRSRSQSPSLAQILGLSGSQKRTSATASRSSSPQQGGMFTGFFTTQPSRSRSKQSKKGFFNFANSSSSSADSGLAFGGRPSKNGSTSRRVTKKSSDEHLKATLLGISATAAAISAVQRGKSGSKKSNPTRPRNQDIRYGTQRSKADTSEEDGWESATDDESVSSGLAFGDFDGKVPRWQRRSESITSQSSGTDKWSWRWRRKPDKKITADDMSQDYHEDTYSGKEPSVASSQPLQYVHPVPISSPMYSETRSDPSMPGAFPEKQYASERIPIQQPQPVVPLQPNILHDQTPPHASQFDQPSPRVTTRPTIPTELRRTQSSPVSSHTMRNAAIAGLAGAAAAGILSNGRSRARDDSPSNVRFELTEKQAKKEERQQRKDDAKESRERAKVEARENKERARLDRARAMQEESERVAAENARRYAEEAERQKFLADQAEEHQARLQKAAAAEAREREEDRQREEEIKEFMKNALAEQAREAEAKKQREAWESHRIAATGQISPPDSRAGPSTNSTPAVDRSQGYSGDRSQQDGNSSTNMPYATRSYEPSNEHSGQPLMDDDLIDPDFFTRRRSHSELARHEGLARKAAAKIIADLEDKYKDPAPSQAEFFAPKELFEPSKGKTKVHGPIDDDTDYHVYRMTEDQAASMPSEPPPPYQPSTQFANLRDLKGTAPWDIPKLNVIAPTPPASYAGSAKGDKSPISASKKDVRKPSQNTDTEIEPQKSSKVSWGEDQTRFYEITTPQSSQEQIISELPHEEYGSRTGYVNPESAKAEFSDSRDVTDNANSSNDEADEPIEEIFRDPLFTSSGRLYQQPFVESVDDISFTMDSPGTEGAPPVQGFIEGEIDDVDEIENQMPHVPGGFEDTTPAPQSEDTFNTDIQNLSRKVMQEQQAPRRYEPSQQSESSQFSDRDQDDYFTTGKQRRRRDKEARRTSLDQDRDRQSPVHDHRAASPTYQTHAELTEDDPAPKQKHSTSKSGLPDDLSNAKQFSGYDVAGAMAGAAAAVGALVNNDSSRSATRRMSEPEVERQRESRSQSQPRDPVSISTPTSPVYERRQSLPSHAFDDLDMLPGSKRPKKSKRNSLLNYPTIGSPLRSAMTWDEYIEPLNTAQHDKPARSQSDENWDDLENPVEDTNMETKKDLPSPESERGAASVVSAPVGDEENGRRRKSRKSHREREGSTSPRRSASVAMSEPFEGSRKHKRRSHRDDDGFEDATSARSRSSHSSKRDEDESRSKKKGGILNLFRRKTSDDILSNEQKRTNGDDERSKHHHRRHSSEYAVDEFNERRGSTSRSRSHAEKDEASSRHSSSSRHRRRHHRDGSVDEDDAGSQVSESRRRHKHRSRDHSRSPEEDFNDTQSQASESRRRHRHRDRDLDLDDRRSLSRGSKIINDEDKSFLVERVEDEEPTPLPVDDVLSSSQAPASVEQSQEPISRSTSDEIEIVEQPDESTTSPTVSDELKDSPDVAVPANSDEANREVVEAQSSPSSSESLSPPLEHLTPARPIVPLRISSSTAVPLRFRCPPTSPGLPRERSASFSSSVAQSPSSPITPKAKRPLSTEFMHSTEFRPLYLLERTRKPQEQEAEQNLPSLPPSRSASSSSLQSSEDWQSAAEDFEPGEQDDLGVPAFDQFHTDEPEDVLGSAQTTPKATEFPKHVLESRPHLEPEYYTWSDMEREEHLRREAENEHHDKQKEEVPPPSDGQTGPISAEKTISPSADTEIAVNKDPMATDVWGEMSDEELPSTEVPVLEDSAEPTTQPQESEAGSNPAVLTKKHKNKKAPKLGTSSVSELTSPVRETPAELARRREKDAQDAVDTWFKPEAKPNQESPDNASLVPLPESTTPTEKETSGPVQDSEVSTPEIEPGSPLLSRKKSKKGKKKQRSVVLNEPDPEPAPSEKPSEPQLIANMDPQQEVPVEVQAQVKVEEGQTRTVSEETAQGQESVPAPSETVSPTEHIVESATPLDDMQPHDDAQTEEPVYTMSKAERKKNKKKAKKAALSIAVPVIAGAVSATSEEHDTEELAAKTEPALVKDREDKRPNDEMPGDAIASAETKPSSEIDTKEQQVAAAEPMSPSHPHAELPPEQVALPQEIHNYMNELEVVDPAAEPATESTHVPEAPLEEQTQPKSGEVLEEEPQNTSDTAPEATSKRSSWFSWLPGSKKQITEDSMAESKAPEHEPEEANVLTQEPFERLLEQPMLHPEFVDESNASSDASKDVSGLNPREVDQSETMATTEETQNEDSFVEDTKVPTGQPQLEEDLQPTTQVSTENTEDVEIVESTRSLPQENSLSAEANPRTSEHAPAMEESTAGLQDSNAADASDNVLNTRGKMSHVPQEEDPAPVPDEDPEPAEDLWTMPSKKSKKGKKAKKAAKEKALSEVASPSPIITENKSLDHNYLPSDNSNIIESANTIEVAESEPLSNADTQVSSIDVVADEPAPGTSVVEDTGLSAARISEATRKDDLSEAVSQVPEPDAESPKETVIPAQPDAQSATAGEVEQDRIDEPLGNAEPPTATAEDEWAMPSSKKKKKKGKEGKQPLTEVDDSTQDTPATEPPEIQRPEVPDAIEHTPVTPDVFETPAEDVAAQYSATPADEFADQDFVTPVEESPEQHPAVHMDEAEPPPAIQENEPESTPHEQLRDQSSTPTQSSQDESSVLVHEPLTLEPSDQTDTTADDMSSEVASKADAEISAIDCVKDKETDIQDETKPLGAEQVVEPTSEPTPEPSSASTQIEPIDRSASTPETDLPKNLDAHLESTAEEKSLPEKQTSDKIPSSSSEPDVLDAATAELEPQATAESIAFTTISTKKSKKDKKKAKKAKQQEGGSEPFQNEIADLDSPTAPVEASELPVELKDETSETNDVSIPSEPQQLPETEAVVEEKPIARKLSKKEKRKAKKVAVSGRATPFEDTPEQATMNQDVTSYFPDTTEHDTVADSREVEPSEESQAEVLFTPLDKSGEAQQDVETSSPDQVEHEKSPINFADHTTIDNEESNTVEPDATIKDVTADVTSAAHDLDTTEKPLHEAQLETTDLNEKDVLPAEVDSKEPAGLLNDAQKEDQEISPQIIEPEPADVKDQAPGILDQLILAQESSVAPESKLVYNDESLVDVPSIEAEDHTVSLDSEFTPAEPTIESLDREEPVSKTETLAKNVEGPPARHEPEPEQGPVLESLESASEEQSQAVADLAPLKMSKKDKRKARKLKQTVEPTLERSDPVDNQITKTEPSLPIVEEDIQPLETLDQETPEVTDDVVPEQLTEDFEPFTAKLSKKVQKKAKKTKTKSTGFDDENDDPPSMLPQPGGDLTARFSGDHMEESVIEPFQTPSTEPVAQVGSGTGTGVDSESTALLGKDLSQDLESAPEHSVDNREVTEVATQPIDDLEHASDPQSVNSAESASKDIEGLPTEQIAETARDNDYARQVPPEYKANDKIEIAEATEDPQVVNNEVTPATAPVHNETKPLEDKEQSTAQIPETLVPEQEHDFFTGTTSKKKKKGKKAKLQQETVVTEVPDDKSLPEPANDPEKSAADTIESPQYKPDMPMATMVESTIQPIIEEEPSTALADEWKLSTKKSKKEKRKAKKLQNLEDDLPRESIKQEPVVELAMAEEAEEISAPPTSQATESVPSGAEPESVVDPDANDDWSFSRKLSKKEKRKNKKAPIIDELPKGTEPVAMTENASEVQNAHSSDQTSENSDVKLDPTECGREETSSAGDIIAVEDASSEPAIQEDEAAPTKDKEPASTSVDVSQDIDFAATLAAGLQDSGFDPSLVIDDPVFHRRASPTSVGEADPGEVTTTTKRRSKKSTGQSGHASPLQDVSREPPSIETSQPTEESTNDDFSDALTASLIASGFAPNALANLSPDIEDAQAEPEEFSFAIPKRKKKGKKSTRTEMTTSEAPAPTDKPESQVSESDIQKSIPAEIDKVPAQEPKAAQEEIPTIGRDVGGPTGASPKRSANPTFFHTSEVSQFLPVSIDHLVQSDKELVEPSPQQSADPSMIETMAKDIPQSTLEDAHAAPTTDSPRLPAPATIYKEPATWSFDNLESPTMEQIPNPDQAVLENDPFVSSNLIPETEEQIAETEPISPVESTTKDRTSYLFQSPVNMAGLDKDKDLLPEITQKQTSRFHEPEEFLGSNSDSRPRTPPAPLPPSPSQVPHMPLPPTPSRIATPPAPLPPSPSRQQASLPGPLPPVPHPDRSPPLTRKKSLYDIGSPGPGHSSKAARRSATPQQSFRAQIDSSQSEGIPGADRSSLDDRVPMLRSVDSNRSLRSNREQARSMSSASKDSAAPSLRRINGSLSGDLRAASTRRGDVSTHGPPTTIPIEPPPTPPLQDEEFNGHGASRPSDMANIYEGWGDVRSSPTVSPTRPPSMRKRQSMHILDLEAKLDQLASENRYLQDAIDQTTSAHPPVRDNDGLQDMLRARDLQLQEKDAEIQQIRSLLEPLQREIAKLTEVNNNLSEVNRSFTANNDVPYATLQSEHSQAHRQLQQTSQELESLKRQHHELSDNMEDIVRQEIANALEDKNAEIRKLREELDVASQQIRLLQSEILASKGDNWLTIRDEDYFDTSCQKLCQHVQQWVLRFSKYSDNRMCRLTSDLTDEKIAARLDNAILDGSDVDKLLGDRVRRRHVFMSVVMTMIWEYVFTRYLFGMDREQRQKLKSLEKILSEVGPARAVAQWRATTLTLLSRRPAFATQRNLDTEAVAQEIFSVLSALLPPPAQLETQILSSLRNVLRVAVELSIEMRSQKAEYIMLPPLQPEYDTQGDLVRKVHFNAALMNERSGDYTSNDELERTQAVVKIVLYPLVVKKGDDFGEGEDEIVVCPAQVLVAGSKQGKKVVRVLSGAMDIDNPRRSNQSIISGLESGGMI